MIVLVVFFILIAILFFIKLNITEQFLTYTKCDRKPIKHITKDLFEKHGITKFDGSKHNSADSWDIFMPCGYAFIERDLNSIEIKSNNQKIFAIRGCNKIKSAQN